MFAHNGKLFVSPFNPLTSYGVEIISLEDYTDVISKGTELFIARDELYIYNETSQQSELLKDINLTGDSNPNHFIEFNSQIYFSANDGINGIELWVTDGTEAGTSFVKDINTTDSSTPKNFTVFQGNLYFTADDGVNGVEIWKTDGTTNGTTLFADINVSGSGDVNDLFTDSNNLYFSANDGISGVEIWTSDGTVSGTQLLKNISSTGDSEPSGFTLFGNDIYFVANDGVNGKEVWKTDGTESGTIMLSDINPTGNSNPGSFIVSGNHLYFNANNGIVGKELWRTDGTSVGTQLPLDIYSQQESITTYITEFNGKMYFGAKDGVHGNELWVSDGTTTGTQLFVNLNLSGNSNPDNFHELNGELIFTTSQGLWKTDGTVAGTISIMPLSISPQFEFEFYEYNSELYFNAGDGINGFELWKTNGTIAGTQMIIDLNPNNGHGNPHGFVEFQGKLYFIAKTSNANGSYRIWTTDGTVLGTVQAFSMEASAEPSSELFVHNGYLYFASVSIENPAMVIHRTDSDEANVEELDVFCFGCEYLGGGFSNQKVIDNYLYFFNTNDGPGSGVYRINLATLDAEQIFSTYYFLGTPTLPLSMGAFDSKVYFVGSNARYAPLEQTYSHKIFTYDDTGATTLLVNDGITPSGSAPKNISNIDAIQFEDKLYFAEYDESLDLEIWTLKEGENTPVLEYNLNPFGDSGFQKPIVFNGKLYFVADDGTKSFELYVIDETLSVSDFSEDNNKHSVLYPNPVNQVLNVESKEDIQNITIFDIDGRQIKNIPVTHSTMKTSFKISDLANGFYFVKIKLDNGTQHVHKIIKK